jgi:alkylation response protein AidB-like acyl-CoA dehydrogenase
VDFALDPALAALQERARRAALNVVAPHARSSDAEGVFRREVIDELAGQGFLGLPIPARLGGGGLGSLAMSLVYEEFGRVDSSVRGFLAVHVGLVSQCIVDWGTPEQKERWLPALARGDVFGCYCLTEPEAGSDAASITTRAERTDSGWLLNGAKHWITNGNVADVALVFATVDVSLRSRGVTAFVVDTTRPGFRREAMPGKELGHRGSDHARIRLENLEVPEDAVLGEVGSGFKVAMAALDHGRLGVAAGAVGVLQACLDACLDFGRTRRQFGKRIGDFEMIQATLADMAVDAAAARWLVRHAAWLRDSGARNTQEVSLAKLFATEAAARAADQAVLVHGGRGYSNEYPVERYFRDIKGLQIYEGTSHIQRIIIARHLLGKDEGSGSA